MLLINENTGILHELLVYEKNENVLIKTGDQKVIVSGTRICGLNKI